MKTLDKVFKALADTNRVRILKLLEKRKMCVCELAYILGVSQPAMSKQLKKITKAGFIESEQDGFWTNYFISTRNDYAKSLSGLLSSWLNDETIIKEDLKKARKANRKKLCCKR
ncbi:MAG: metalloregulator ArsR/SmtB family transcription factor [Candidatus Omnitrophica bacterium]|jgi:ArsR family transcriptional regulator|nr:metalloregulator ArsR/SmtB family transcription factor [Candidatus Omnitrophota bacterium]MDD5500679.1 metalloregulator ArsR/SmtB family transcription factor [Candidatus Omnitrophota bacterium]